MSDNHTILIVEDNDFVRMQLVSFVKEAGYIANEAADGREALDLMAASNDISLAIVDVRMEPMGGFDFIRVLKSRDIKKPVILVTGDRTPDLLEQSGKLGVGAVLMKPVEKDRLLTAVEKILKKSERRKR